MRVLPVLIVLSVACGPATGVIDETGGEPLGDDTAAPGDTAPPGDTDADTEPPGPDFATWQGERTFTFEVGIDCTETVDEAGANVTDDPLYADALAACQACDHLFRIEVDPAEICAEETLGPDGFAVESPAFRGLALDETGGAEVFRIDQDRSGDWRVESLAEGVLLDTDLEYTYDGTAWGLPYDATGLVDF